MSEEQNREAPLMSVAVEVGCSVPQGRFLAAINGEAKVSKGKTRQKMDLLNRVKDGCHKSDHVG